MMTMLSLLLALATLGQATSSPKPFAIEVVDAETGRGVPLIELKTTNNIPYVTDSNGLVAVDDLDLMGQTVHFQIRGHGYEYPADGFGIRGKALKVEPGEAARLEVNRINLAERLYRVTGGGIYRDTVELGREAPLEHPLLNALVFGSDSVMSIVHNEKIYWFWGDTNRPSYPLGNFHTPGATSALPGRGGLDPAVGVNLSYDVDDNGFAKETARMPGEGPTWISAPALIPDAQGNLRIVAGYAKIKPPLETYERGIIIWNDEESKWDRHLAFDHLPRIYHSGHAFTHRDQNGVEYVTFTTPYPITRVQASLDAISDATQYEGFSPLKPGTTPEEGILDRDESGKIRYGWKPNTPPLDPRTEKEFVESGKLAPEEAILALRDVETGRPILGHGGTVAWNSYRNRWVMIVLELFGESSVLGEIWYAESDAPTGPWVYARKVVTHDTYSFYNPRHHPFFDQKGGRIIYFEGTYTELFSGAIERTPRYDYNQIMYRLDLDNPRLKLPIAMDMDPALLPEDPEVGQRYVDFLALEEAQEGTVPIYEVRQPSGSRRLVAGMPPDPEARPTFHAMSGNTENPSPNLVGLYEFTREDAPGPAYSAQDSIPGFQRAESPVCLVWRNPIRIPLPPRTAPGE